jgi:hypothetical protein
MEAEMTEKAERKITVDKWAEEMRAHIEEFVAYVKAGQADPKGCFDKKLTPGDWDESFAFYDGSEYEPGSKDDR